MTPTILHWFRHDLRLSDHPSWCAAVAQARRTGARLLAVYVHDPSSQAPTRWSPVRMGGHRQRWLTAHLRALDASLQAQGHRLWVWPGRPEAVLPRLMAALNGVALHTETWPAPEEQTQEAALASAASTGSGAAAWVLHRHAPSVLLPTATLPWSLARMPDGFTPMRHAIERQQDRDGDPWPAPLDAPATLPPPPGAEVLQGAWPCGLQPVDLMSAAHAPGDSGPQPPHSAFPWRDAHAPITLQADMPAHRVRAGEAGAQAHLQHYLSRGLPHSYKGTRNQLLGLDFSSKWSPWLAVGGISAPQLMQALRDFEAEQGASDGSHWLWFELLWREHFRLLQLKHGLALYRWRGLCDAPTARKRLGTPAPAGPDSDAAHAWRTGQTGQPLVDAGMRELAATGFLSNRMRQIVASFLVHDLRVDWRVGAAWFESQLLDFDVHSNQGNWLYIAGLGTDPRGGRRFDPIKQTREHDPDGRYQATWLAPSASTPRAAA